MVLKGVNDDPDGIECAFAVAMAFHLGQRVRRALPASLPDLVRDLATIAVETACARYNGEELAAAVGWRERALQLWLDQHGFISPHVFLEFGRAIFAAAWLESSGRPLAHAAKVLRLSSSNTLTDEVYRTTGLALSGLRQRGATDEAIEALERTLSSPR